MAEITISEVKVDAEKLKQVISNSDELRASMEKHVSRITANANAMSAGYRTGRFYDRAEGRLKGNTQPVYSGDVQKRGGSLVGLIHPGNYAAMKDNHEHNTLLKSI